MSKRYVIAGFGAAGWSAAQAIRSKYEQGIITVISDEKSPPYARMLLSCWLKGKIEEEAIHLFPNDVFKSLNTEALYEKRAEKIDTDRQTVILNNGESIPYDELLIASGASPVRPEIKGIDLPGVLNLWTRDDTLRIREGIRENGEAVVIGAGFIGMQAVDALLKLNVRCSLIEALLHVLPRILDPEGAGLIESRLKREGVDIFTDTTVKEIGAEGKRKEIVLDSGRTLQADLVITAAGVRPNLDLAKTAVLKTDTGILVDECMRTSSSHVYAAGDVAESLDFSTGGRGVHAIWPTAVDQGWVAGMNMAGASVDYPGSLNMNTLDVLDIPLASVGLFQGDGLEIGKHTESSRGIYRKIAFRDGRLTGAVLLGDISDIGIIRSMIHRRVDITSVKSAVVFSPVKLGRTWPVYGGIKA